jgi:hypothetical protein
MLLADISVNHSAGSINPCPLGKVGCPAWWSTVWSGAIIRSYPARVEIPNNNTQHPHYNNTFIASHPLQELIDYQATLLEILTSA